MPRGSVAPILPRMKKTSVARRVRLAAARTDKPRVAGAMRVRRYRLVALAAR